MKFTRNSRFALTATASVAALSLAWTGQAAAQDSPDSATVGEVVVTAQFREQNIQQTPIAITAVNAAMLEQRSQTSVEQVANQAPNVTLKPQGTAFGPSLAASIRGVGQYDFNPALEPGVGLYVDDVYYPTLTGSILDLLDLDRLEILRGPQGTLAGKNSIGGAVKLYSKKPNGETGGFIQGAYGSLDRMELRGGVNFALVPDKLFARLSGVHKQYDGYVDRLDYKCANPSSTIPTLASGKDCLLGTEGGRNYSAFRGALRWLATDKLEVNLIADVTTEDSDPAANVVRYANNTANPNIQLGGTPYDSRFVTDGQYIAYATFRIPSPPGLNEFIADPAVKFKGWGTSATVDYKLNDDMALKYIASYRSYTSSWADDNDASPLVLGLGANRLRNMNLSQELRLNGSLGSAIDYTVGGFYFRQKSVYSTHQYLMYVVGAGPLFDFFGGDPVKAHTKAGFAHAVWHATDKLNVTGGLRYTKEDKSYTFSRTNRAGAPHPILGATNGVQGNYAGDRWDYRVSLDYQVLPNLMAYVTTSTGFKGGGINPRPFVIAQVQPFGPETLTAYEAGFKSTLFDRKVRLNGAVFDNKYKNIQLTLLSCPQFGGPGPCALPSNAGDATLKGAELELEARPTQGLTIDGSISYIDFQFTRIDPAAGGPTSPGGVQINMKAPFTPKWKWSAGVQYEIPLQGLGSITPRIDVSHQSSLFTNAVNGPNNQLPSYTTANGRLTWRPEIEGLEVSFEVTNLFDKYYYVTLFDLSGPSGSATGQPAMPRQWAVTVKKTF